jgi:simple sugar transport system ATP-binding protein
MPDISQPWPDASSARIEADREGARERRMTTNPQTQIAISASGITKRFGHLEALRGAEIELRQGEVLALVGDNGAGKSTLAKIICGALAPDGGQLRFWDEPVQVQSIAHAYELGVGVVYQDLSLALDLSVADTLFLGREPNTAGWGRLLGVLDRARMREAAEAALLRLGIRLKSMSVPVRNLSGGQRQALAVARAMMWAETAILMDEPTAALGPTQTQIVFNTIRTAATRGMAVLVISHDIPRMLTIADRVAVMRHGLVIATRPASELDLNDVISLMLGGEAA